MGKIHSPLPVKLFVGLLTAIPELVPEVGQRLSSAFGPVERRSDPFPFDATHYYDDEMGWPISRHFFSFIDLITPAALAEIKVKTNQMESVFAAEASKVRRPINLDPGYLEQAKIVLASTKNFYHRIFLSDGVYAEVTMHFENGVWQAFPWTFPDFRTGRYDAFFSALRGRYRAQLKETR